MKDFKTTFPSHTALRLSATARADHHHHTMLDRHSVLSGLCLRASAWLTSHGNRAQRVSWRHETDMRCEPWLGLVEDDSVCMQGGSWARLRMWLFTLGAVMPTTFLWYLLPSDDHSVAQMRWSPCCQAGALNPCWPQLLRFRKFCSGSFRGVRHSCYTRRPKWGDEILLVTLHVPRLSLATLNPQGGDKEVPRARGGLATALQERAVGWSQPVSRCGGVVPCGDVGHPVTQLVTKPGGTELLEKKSLAVFIFGWNRKVAGEAKKSPSGVLSDAYS